MKAIVFTLRGASSVLTSVERELVAPGPGEVRVRLVRAGVNPTDWKFRTGAAMSFDEVTPGQDGAGVVDAVGDGVDGLEPGQRVWLILAQYERPGGTAAEYTVQPARLVVPLPEGASFDLGASLGVPAVTAHRALTSIEGGPPRLGPGALDGRVVLVAGGAGAVGNAAIQLAAWAGATVVTTVSSDEKAALATAAGAHHTVNYREGDAAKEILAIAPDGVDLVVELAPAQNNGLDLQVVRNRGTVAIYANNGGDQFTIDVRRRSRRNLRYQFLLLYTLGTGPRRRRGGGHQRRDRRPGRFRRGGAGRPLHHHPLEETAAAHDAVEQGDGEGADRRRRSRVRASSDARSVVQGLHLVPGPR